MTLTYVQRGQKGSLPAPGERRSLLKGTPWVARTGLTRLAGELGSYRTPGPALHAEAPALQRS